MAISREFNICKTITSADNNTKVIIQSTGANEVAVITELQLMITLNSISEFAAYSEDPYLTEDQKNALFWQQAALADSKKVTTWYQSYSNNQYKKVLEFLIFKRLPYYNENLLQRFTGIGTFTLAPNSEISLSVDAVNTGLLGSGDTLTLWGQGYSYSQDPKLDEVWETTSLLNGWQNYGSPAETFGFRQNEYGRCSLKGLVKNISNNVILAILPQRYRPPSQVSFPAATFNAATGQMTTALVFISADGILQVSGYGGTWLTLDGINYFV